MREGESESDVRTAAYLLWQARGRLHGQDELDWYAAKLLVTRRLSNVTPPYKNIHSALVLNDIALSHSGHDELFSPSTRWAELSVHPCAVFDCDRNRRLHFDEGFLCACHRIFKDHSITSIARSHHFPYRDLVHFRRSTDGLVTVYRGGASMAPPVFFYPAPYQLEILDGVHRCLAAYELALQSDERRGFSPADYRIWLGFDGDKFDVHHIAHQLWVISLFHAGRLGNGRADDHS